MLDFHNLSQDSGISPSPQMSNSTTVPGGGGRESLITGIYDNHRVPEQHPYSAATAAPPTPNATNNVIDVVSPPQIPVRGPPKSAGNVSHNKNTPQSKSWRFGGLFKRKGSASEQSSDVNNFSGDEQPQPQQQKQPHHFQQLRVKDPPPPVPYPGSSEVSSSAPPLPPRSASSQASPSGTNVFQPTMRVKPANNNTPNYDNSMYYYESSLGSVSYTHLTLPTIYSV